MYMHDPTGLIHLQAHTVVDLVVCQCNVILVDSVPVAEQHQRRHLGERTRSSSPFFQLDLRGIRPRLRRDEFLQIADGIIWATLDPYCEEKFPTVSNKGWMISVLGSDLCDQADHWR